MVGAAFCRGFEEFEIFLIKGLKNGVPGRWRVAFAHELHVQAASLRAILDSMRGKAFILLLKSIVKLQDSFLSLETLEIGTHRENFDPAGLTLHL